MFVYTRISKSMIYTDFGLLHLESQKKTNRNAMQKHGLVLSNPGFSKMCPCFEKMCPGFDEMCQGFCICLFLTLAVLCFGLFQELLCTGKITNHFLMFIFTSQLLPARVLNHLYVVLKLEMDF